MRIQGNDLRTQEPRLKLQDVVPLDGPLVIYFEPTNVCNFRCDFCPTGDNELIKKIGRPVGYMKFDLWKKIVDDLKEFPNPLKCAHMFKDGESLLHPKFPEMLAYLRDSGRAEKIWMKSNGTMLNPVLNQKLVDNGLDQIGISINGVSEAQYKHRVHAKVDYEKLRANVLDLYNRRGKLQIYIKILSQLLTPDEIEKYFLDWEDRGDFIGLENLHGWSTGQEKDLTLGFKSDTYDGGVFTKKIACPLTFYSLSVTWDGKVSICQEDWARKLIVGDLTKQSMMEIWHGDALYQIRKMHLEGRRHENDACRECYYIQVVPDVVDDYREQMLKKLAEGR